MKRKIVLFLLICQCLIAFGYELGKKTSFGSSLSCAKIYENSKEIADICFLDPNSNFDFFSIESNPELFNNVSLGIDTIAKSKNIKPYYAILADFNHQTKPKGKFSFGYLLHSLGIFLFAPDYVKKVNILNPETVSERFFMNTELNGKEIYSVIIFNKTMDIKLVKKIIRETNGLKPKSFKLYSLLDFPLALMTFGEKNIIVYETNKSVKKYSCLYLANKKRFKN